MARSCFLFGHADAPQTILPILEQAIENEVSKETTVFYVGYHGAFDRLATTALKAVKRRHSEITLMLLLAYHPAEQPIELPQGFDGTFYPPIEKTPRKFAITKANKYMIQNVESIICYVCHVGNTRQLLNSALHQEKIEVKNIAGELS